MTETLYLFCFNILLLLIIVFQFKQSKQFIMQPSLIFTASFFVAFFVWLVTSYWDFSFSISTYLVVLATIIAFSMGCSASRHIKFNGVDEEGYIYIEKKNANALLLIIQILCLIVITIFTIRIGGGLSASFIKNVRNYYIYESMPAYIGHIDLIMFSAAAIAGYLMLYNKFEIKSKLSIKHIIIILCYLAELVLSSSRSPVIYYFAYFLTLFVYFFQKDLIRRGFKLSQQHKKIIKPIVIAVVLVLVSFVLLGNLTGKTEMIGAGNMFRLYFGGSLYNLDYLMRHPSEFVSPNIGSLSFPILDSILGILGLRTVIPTDNVLINRAIPLTIGFDLHSYTNLYSCIAKPFIDFGYIGMLIVFLALGILYGYFYYKILRYNKKGLMLIYYAYLVMAIVGVSSAWMFGGLIFTASGVYKFLYIFIIFKLCVSRCSCEKI